MPKKSSVSAQAPLKLSWDGSDLKDPAPGCFLALYAMISPSQQITVPNMGRAWMGLAPPVRTARPINFGEESPEPNSDDIGNVSGNYEWEAKPGDIVVVASHLVKQVLTSEQIFASTKTFEGSGLDEHIPGNSREYGSRAMGIVDGAQVASNGPQQDDMTATVAEI